jgi:hypothetical protein
MKTCARVAKTNALLLLIDLLLAPPMRFTVLFAVGITSSPPTSLGCGK